MKKNFYRCQRMISGFLAVIMVFSMIVELAAGIPVSAASWESTITGEIEDITASSIAIDAEIKTVAKDKIKIAGFSYGITSTEENKIILKKSSTFLGTKTYTVSETIKKLKPDTHYTGYYYLETKDGTVLKGEEITFTTLKPITGAVSKTTETTISVSAELDCSTADHFNKMVFCYGIESPEENSVELKSTEKYFNGKIKASKTIKKLESNTNYVGYFYAKKKDGTVVQGTPITFSTNNPITGTIGHVYSDHVSINAELKCEKADNFRKIGFCYGTAKPEENTIVLKEKKSDFTGNTKASVTIENLTANTTYVGYFYAEKKDGTKITSSLHTITTPETLVGQIKKTYDSSVSVSGTLYSGKADNINLIGFSYGKTDPEENKAVIKETKKHYINKTSFSKTIKGLEPNTTYVGYLYAKSADGKTWNTEPETFRTPVTTITSGITEIKYDRVTFTVNRNSSENSTIKSVEIHYGTDVNCTETYEYTKNATSFTQKISKLKKDTQYYYYISATSKDGYIYKTALQTFKTTPGKVQDLSFSIYNEDGVTYNTLHHGETQNIKISLNDKIKYFTEIIPMDVANKKITVVSSDENIVKINNNIWLEAVSAGTATITATTIDGGFSASYIVTVKDTPYHAVKPDFSVKALDNERIQVKVNDLSFLGDYNKIRCHVYYAKRSDGTYARKRVMMTNGSAIADDFSSQTEYYIKILLEVQYDNITHYTDYSDILTVKTHSRPEPEEEETETETKAPGVSNPVINTGDTPAEPNPVTDQKPEVDGLLPSYTISKGGTLTLDFTVEDPLGGVVEKVTVKHNQTGSTCTASLSNSNGQPGVFTCHFDIDHAIFDTVGTYDFEVYARTTHFTVTDNRLDDSSFTVKVEDKPVTEQEPKVVGLDPAYTVEKGGTLILDFTVEDPLGGVVEKVTVKHNQTGSTCTASLSNNKPGVFTCHFDIDHSIFDKVGTYNFEVYARTTHFTITDNRLDHSSFTVKVVENKCSHERKYHNDTYKSTEYVSLNDSKHEIYQIYERNCKNCGDNLGDIRTLDRTEKHSYLSTQLDNGGYFKICSVCGHEYINTNGYVEWTGYLHEGNTAKVYLDGELSEYDNVSKVYRNDDITVLGVYDNSAYLIKYPVTGGTKTRFISVKIIDSLSNNEIQRTSISVKNKQVDAIVYDDVVYTEFYDLFSAMGGSVKYVDKTIYHYQGKVWNALSNVTYYYEFDLEDYYHWTKNDYDGFAFDKVVAKNFKRIIPSTKGFGKGTYSDVGGTSLFVFCKDVYIACDRVLQLAGYEETLTNIYELAKAATKEDYLALLTPAAYDLYTKLNKSSTRAVINNYIDWEYYFEIFSTEFDDDLVEKVKANISQVLLTTIANPAGITNKSDKALLKAAIKHSLYEKMGVNGKGLFDAINEKLNEYKTVDGVYKFTNDLLDFCGFGADALPTFVWNFDQINRLNLSEDEFVAILNKFAQTIHYSLLRSANNQILDSNITVNVNGVKYGLKDFFNISKDSQQSVKDILHSIKKGEQPTYDIYKNTKSTIMVEKPSKSSQLGKILDVAGVIVDVTGMIVTSVDTIIVTKAIHEVCESYREEFENVSNGSDGMYKECLDEILSELESGLLNHALDELIGYLNAEAVNHLYDLATQLTLFEAYGTLANPAGIILAGNKLIVSAASTESVYNQLLTLPTICTEFQKTTTQLKNAIDDFMNEPTNKKYSNIYDLILSYKYQVEMGAFTVYSLNMEDYNSIVKRLVRVFYDQNISENCQDNYDSDISQCNDLLNRLGIIKKVQ